MKRRKTGATATGVVGALIDRLDRLERRVGDQARGSQAGYRSVEEGESVPFYDTDGTVRTVVGQQPDGSYTTVDYGGDAPDAPSVPVVEARPGALMVTWDGYDAGGEAGWPASFGGCLVHVTTDPGTVLDADTEIHRFTSPAGGSITLALPEATVYYVTLQTVTSSGVLSEESGTVAASVADFPTPPPTAGQTFSADPPPATTEGFPEGHGWWQVAVDEETGSSKVVGFWRATGAVFVPTEIVTAEALVARNAIIEALSTTDLAAVNFQSVNIVGGSVYIAQGGGGSVSSGFGDGTLPVGWSSTKTGPAGADPPGNKVPGASVVPSGPNEAGNGALLVDLGPSGVADATGSASGEVSTPLELSSNAEVTARFRYTVQGVAGEAGQVCLAIRSSDGPAFSPTWDAITLDLVAATQGPLLGRSVVVRLWLNGIPSVLGYVPVPQDPTTTWHHARLRVLAGRVQAKVWRDGAAEPGWTGFQQTSLATPGRASLVWQQDTARGATRGQLFYVDRFQVDAYAAGFVVNPDGSGSWPALVQTGRAQSGDFAASGDVNSVWVEFPTPFSAPPNVVLTVRGVQTPSNVYAPTYDTPTAEGFTMHVQRAVGVASVTVAWQASP